MLSRKWLCNISAITLASLLPICHVDTLIITACLLIYIQHVSSIRSLLCSMSADPREEKYIWHCI